MKILVFVEGTILMHFSGKNVSRLERVKQSQDEGIQREERNIAFNSNTEINVRPYYQGPYKTEDGSILLQLKFYYVGLTVNEARSHELAPPGRITYNFESNIIAKPNQPMIVGGMQSGDSSLLLVVRAEIVK